MSLSVNDHMNSIFLRGITQIRASEKDILKEWEKVIFHLRNTGKNSVHVAEDMVEFYSSILFKKNFDEREPLLELENTQLVTTLPSYTGNKFIGTLLENSTLQVIQAIEPEYHEYHHAIQFVFSIINEKIFIPFDIDIFLKALVQSQQLPINWAAIIKQNENIFTVEKWFDSSDETLSFKTDEMRADSIYSLSEALIRLNSKDRPKNGSVLPIPHEDRTILFYSTENPAIILPFLSYSLQVFQKGRETLKISQQEIMWKDFVIMFNENIMRSKTLAEAVEQISVGFIKFLPFERCALFSYSMNEQMGFGLFGKHLDNKAIQSITEDINNLPIIQNYLQLLEHLGRNNNFIQPIFIKDAAAGFPKEYVEQFQLGSIVIAPIFTTSTNKLLGAAILDQGPGKYFKAPKETFSALLKFGQSAGELLSRFYSTTSEQQKSGTKHFSPREIEVLKLMADGASTNEAANKLNLSEYTVRDYVSTIMQKMEAKNRTEAVAKAIREGFI